ncbi:MAG: DUF2793 domain-containing protein [Pseudomonadota bacterium]|nr:DUF2793 domain-containing protein [Pseudomonadota bacterium]
MSATPRLGLPHLIPGQAQKEFTHNEALQGIDSLLAGAVEGDPADTPPAAPLPGSCYIVGPSPSGAWAGRAGSVASYSDAGWRFLPPVEGMSLLMRSSGVQAVYRGGGWEIGVVRAGEIVVGGNKVVGTRAAAVAAPAGGTVVDAQARTAIGAILTALRGHGLIAT